MKGRGVRSHTRGNKGCGQILQHGFVILSLGLLFSWVLWSYTCGDRKGDRPLPRPLLQLHMPRSDGLTNQTPKVNNPKVSPASAIKDPGFSADEWDRMLKLVHWGGPDRQITTANTSTSPDHSAFVINDLKGSYYVGEELHVTIVAKDFTKTPKSYGGDFFQAKVYSDKKASVFGELLDHQNGTYSARFTLPWAGLASVAVRLIHSSEAVQVLRRHRSTYPDSVYFYGFYVGNNPQGARVEERVVCNIKWEGVVLKSAQEDCCCEYQNAHIGLTWQCRKPQTLPCSALVYHSMGGYTNHMTALEKVLMDSQHVNRWLKGDSRLIRVMASNATIGSRESCKPGLPTPIPSGFYMNNVWTSFVCAARHFAEDDTTQCLKDKHIYIMGDSTSRQWFDYLIQAVPTLKRMNLHSENQVGPLMAVDVQNNIDLHYRSHGLPLRCLKAPVVSLHYMSNEIDDMAGGPHTVIIFNMWAHFTSFPLSYYANRVSQVRRAVVALLRRAPETKVIIKSANTGYKVSPGSSLLLPHAPELAV
ncbi:NXPE family member 3-like isoform X2 [Clupea harengus]|uniref:NXPE family member 3-like isoform X2 n=1 Tax=Clupea harengus TaxID=7950 RepID=A0A6P8GTU9_CLUHA|nr:NXPE family member 3-like isoform X2 [Clupea harengus]